MRKILISQTSEVGWIENSFEPGGKIGENLFFTHSVRIIRKIFSSESERMCDSHKYWRAARVSASDDCGTPDFVCQTN